MTHLNLEASALLVRHITLLKALEIFHGVLDLACGSGRNGRYLLSRGLPVVFADIDGEKLASLSAVEVSDPAMVTLWEALLSTDARVPASTLLQGLQDSTAVSTEASGTVRHGVLWTEWI